MSVGSRTHAPPQYCPYYLPPFSPKSHLFFHIWTQEPEAQRERECLPACTHFLCRTPFREDPTASLSGLTGQPCPSAARKPDVHRRGTHTRNPCSLNLHLWPKGLKCWLWGPSTGSKVWLTTLHCVTVGRLLTLPGSPL